MHWKRHLLASGAIMAAFVGASAHAQTKAAAQPEAANTIEELVVTAEKREQSLQDVPVAVSAFTSEKRDLIGVNTIADLTNFTPGLEYNAQNDRNTLRGVGRNTNVHAADGSVAQYSDGIYTSSTTEAGKTPLFVDRIEVLRGPQGTLYGRNAIGGAINIISKRPTDTFYAEVRGEYQNFGYSVLEGAISGPTMIPGVEFRAGANWTHQSDGWYQNNVPGQLGEGNVIDTKYVEGQLKFHFTDNFEGWVKLAWQDWHNDGGGPGSRNTWTPAPFPTYEFGNAAIAPTSGYACLTTTATGINNPGITNIETPPGMSLAQACHNAATDDPRKFTSDVPYQVKLTGTTIFASEWDYHFPKMDLKYILGGTHYDYALTGPTPVDQAPIVAFQLPRVLPAGLAGPSTLVIPGGGPVVHPRYAFNYHEALNWVSNELNLASTDKGPLQWILGLYYYDEDYVQPVYTTLMDQPASTLAPGFLTNAVCNVTGFHCPALAPNNRIYDDRPSLNTKSKAAFGQIDWQFTPTWKLTAGLRYTYDRKKGEESLRLLCYDVVQCGVAPELLGSNFVLDLTQPFAGVLTYSPANKLPEGVSTTTNVDPATGFATRGYDEHWSATTGTLGLQWDPSPNTMMYATYSRGYKAGGFRIGIDTTIGASPSTQPEHLDAFEVGLKKQFGRTLQVNAAVFYYNYENDQIPLSVAQTAGAVGPANSIFYNVPKAKSQGFELESIWQPIDHLQFLFNYSYLDAHVTKGDGVVDPADPAALAAGAKPDFAFSACAPVAPATKSPCSADVFTGPGSYYQNAAGAFVPYTGPGGYQRPQSIVGSQLPNAPKNKVAVDVNYTWVMTAGSVTAAVNYVWRDKQYGSLFNRDYYEAPAYDQWDARLTWKGPDGHLTVIAFVKNIADSLGYEGGAAAARRAGYIPGYVLGSGTALQPIPVIGQGTSVVNIAPNRIQENGVAVGYLLTPPRTYGIELQYRF
ncbi:MAG: TonB-dependent receptor [Alphaproteobacteria bacterium]|nr:TonB-dependent receptor [Alphaproteobacteria bacterium]